MAKNYFEHEIKVKYVDNILSKNADWNWFIEYIEENFEVDLSISTSKDFLCKFAEIRDILVYLNKIHEISDEIEINQEWLKNINLISLYCIGKIDFSDLNIKNDFVRLLALYVLSAKIINEKTGSEYLTYIEIYNNYNIFEIYDLSDFSLESEKIFSLINDLNIDFSIERKTFEDNINHIFHPCKKISNQLLLNCDSPNSFSFYNSFNLEEADTWEERYLLELLCVQYQEGDFTPKVQYRDGSTYPDFKIYTPKIINKIKKYYKGTDVEFLIESIDYVLNNVIPSQNTIDKHFLLLKNNIDNYDDEKDFLYLMCSSLEFVLSFFADSSINTNDKIADFNRAISGIDNIQYFSYLNKHNAPIGKNIIQILKDYSSQKACEIDKISEIQDFSTYINNDEIISVIDKDIFYKISDKFEEVLENIKSDNRLLMASVFLDYLLLLIKIKNNKNIISNEISAEIIYIRGLWQETYFEKCSKSLNCISDSIKISNDEIEKINVNMIDKPFAYAVNCLSIKDELLINSMKNISDYPLSLLVSNISINEDFPMQQKIFVDNKHPVDMVVKSALEKLHDKNQYKFRNSLPIEKYMKGIYGNIKTNFSFYFSIFDKTEQLYNIVVSENPKYKFIEYSENLLLAHLTQLFPILENKIREIGEIFGISPICEKLEKYSKLKEPTNILCKIIEFLYKETDQLLSASDFLFIHFALFAENGINIRNECIHGNGYNIKNDEILFAFKVSLFCLHLLEYRVQMIRGKV